MHELQTLYLYQYIRRNTVLIYCHFRSDTNRSLLTIKRCNHHSSSVDYPERYQVPDPSRDRMKNDETCFIYNFLLHRSLTCSKISLSIVMYLIVIYKRRIESDNFLHLKSENFRTLLYFLFLVFKCKLYYD